MGPPGRSATRPEAARRGRNSPVASKGLAKIGEVGKALDRQIRFFPGLGRYADPPFPGGFLLMDSGCLGLAKMKAGAQTIPRTTLCSLSVTLERFPIELRRKERGFQALAD